MINLNEKDLNIKPKDVHLRMHPKTFEVLKDLVKQQQKELNTTNRKEVSATSIIDNAINEYANSRNVNSVKK